MAESPLTIARVLWGSAVLMTVLAAVFYAGLIDLGMEGWRVALVCILVAVMDLVVSAVILTRRRS